MEARQILRGGNSPERPDMYILSYYLVLFLWISRES